MKRLDERPEIKKQMYNSVQAIDSHSMWLVILRLVELGYYLP
jgi:hypothetical protein